ncbi:MAG: hypothetical protein MUC87_02130 [Bacteroidia bacterium]|jgi:hypothetical protein|nr:hypothetical protein [Bacteroidia bacterium]
MSYVFYIPSRKPIAKGWLFKQLLDEQEHSKHSAQVIDERLIEEGEKLHRPGISTRGASIYRTETGYEISLHTLASEGDWTLAVRAAIIIAEYADNRLQPENYGEMEVKEFKTLCTPEWIAQQAEQGTGVILQMVREGKGPLTLFGYRAEYAVGAKLIKQLHLEEATETQAFQALEKHFIEHQNQLIHYQIPPRYQLDGPVGGEPEQMITWNPLQATYLFSSMWIYASFDKGDKILWLEIRRDRLLPLFDTDSHFRPADETNYFAEPFTAEELPGLEQTLRGIAEGMKETAREQVSAPQNSSSEKKPWWKIW